MQSVSSLPFSHCEPCYLLQVLKESSACTLHLLLLQYGIGVDMACVVQLQLVNVVVVVVVVFPVQVSQLSLPVLSVCSPRFSSAVLLLDCCSTCLQKSSQLNTSPVF